MNYFYKSAKRFTLTLILATPALSGYAKLINGPLLGHVEMREANIWVQTSKAETVEVIYFSATEEASKRKSTGVFTTKAEDDFALTLVAGDVKPGVTYNYEVLVDGQKVQGATTYSFTTPPYFRGHTPPPDVSIAVFSGHYVIEEGFEPPYRTMAGNPEIFTTIRNQKPDMAIWTGDLSGLREPDWMSASAMKKRYQQSRSLSTLQPLLANIPQYAVIGPKDVGYPGADRFSPQTPLAVESFRTYWPLPPTGSIKNGALYSRTRLSDVDFFFLDTVSFRHHRHTLGQDSELLGDEQINWLLNELKHSSASFKIIVSGVPLFSPAKSQENYTFAEKERNTLIDKLSQQEIPGVFVVSGGRNFTEMTKHVRSTGYDLFELMTGPVTGRPADQSPEVNYFRVPSTFVNQRNFALLKIQGPEENRVLNISVHEASGNTLWSETIASQRLK